MCKKKDFFLKKYGKNKDGANSGTVLVVVKINELCFTPLGCRC